MRIPDHKIDEIRSAVDAVELVGDYVHLKRSGSNYVGLCPFHQEDTPSFTVDPEKGLYHCFGCNAGGNVFQFLQQIENVGFVEAVRMLAERTGIDLPDPGEDEQDGTRTEGLYHALRFAARFFFRQLTRTETGRQRALAYLRDRDYTAATIKRFGLGYAPDRWDGLLEAATDEGFSEEVLEEAGLVSERNSGDGYYDRFRGRVIFPLFSHVGKVVGFAGRTLDADAEGPKYVNSPETPVYRKSRILYGLYQAKQAIRREEEVLLVEGYTDVLTLHQAGVEHAVATSGTALTSDQIDALERYADRIVLLYDADEAGGRATERAIDRSVEGSVIPYVAALPEGTDPDSFVREIGPEAFREWLDEHRRDLVEYKVEAAERAGTLEGPEGESSVARSVIRSIARIPDPILQDAYVKQARRILGVPDTALYRALEEEADEVRRQSRRRSRREEREAGRRDERSGRANRSGSSRPEGGPPGPPPRGRPGRPDSGAGPLPAEKLLLRLMLERGAPMIRFVFEHMAVEEFTAGPARTVAEVLLHMYEDEEVSSDPLREGVYGEDVQALASDVLVDRHELSWNWERKGIEVPGPNENAEKAAGDAMAFVKERRVDRLLEECTERIREEQEGGEPPRELAERMMELRDVKKAIQNRRFLDTEE